MNRGWVAMVVELVGTKARAVAAAAATVRAVVYTRTTAAEEAELGSMQSTAAAKEVLN